MRRYVARTMRNRLLALCKEGLESLFETVSW